MAKWEDGKLDLGALGALVQRPSATDQWAISFDPALSWFYGKTEPEARLRAMQWLTRALKQAKKALDD